MSWKIVVVVESAGVFHKFLPLLLVELRIMAKSGKITLHTCSGCVPLIYFQLENNVNYFSVNPICLVAYQQNALHVFQETILVKRKKGWGKSYKKTSRTTGMTRRFDKDKNFKLFSICSKMVTEEVEVRCLMFYRPPYNLGDSQNNFSCHNLGSSWNKRKHGFTIWIDGLSRLVSISKMQST